MRGGGEGARDTYRVETHGEKQPEKRGGILRRWLKVMKSRDKWAEGVRKG